MSQPLDLNPHLVLRQDSESNAHTHTVLRVTSLSLFLSIQIPHIYSPRGKTATPAAALNLWTASSFHKNLYHSKDLKRHLLDDFQRCTAEINDVKQHI